MFIGHGIPGNHDEIMILIYFKGEKWSPLVEAMKRFPILTCGGLQLSFPWLFFGGYPSRLRHDGRLPTSWGAKSVKTVPVVSKWSCHHCEIEMCLYIYGHVSIHVCMYIYIFIYLIYIYIYINIHKYIHVCIHV